MSLWSTTSCLNSFSVGCGSGVQEASKTHEAMIRNRFIIFPSRVDPRGCLHHVPGDC